MLRMRMALPYRVSVRALQAVPPAITVRPPTATTPSAAAVPPAAAPRFVTRLPCLRFVSTSLATYMLTPPSAQVGPVRGNAVAIALVLAGPAVAPPRVIGVAIACAAAPAPPAPPRARVKDRVTGPTSSAVRLRRDNRDWR